MARQLPEQAPLQQEYDVIVVGSGAGGMATAVRAAYLGLSVLVVEKTDQIGGTSAWSGGWLWIPRNPLAVRAGIKENLAAPSQYVKSETQSTELNARQKRFLEEGPSMVSFFEENTALNFIDGNVIPDFHESEGHALGGRSVAAAPFDGRLLGDWKYHMRPPLSVISLYGMGIASGADIKHFFNATRSLSSMWYVSKRLLRHGADLLKYGRSTQLVNGNALIGSLLKTAIDLGVRIQTNSPVSSVIKEDCKVVGIHTHVEGSKKAIFAKAVVMAAGGFPHDAKRQKTQFKAEAGKKHYSAAPKTNTGDGLNMAEAIGAKLRDDLAHAGAWSPISRVPTKNGEVFFPHLVERAKPGIIAILPNGKRFTSEADSYHDFMRALYKATPEGEQPYCWLLADHTAQRRWGLGWSRPFPFPTSWFEKNGYLKKGQSWQDLASQIGVPVETLRSTIERFNQDAKTGTDTEFHRGDSPYNRIQGDADNQPNPSLAPLAKAPYYAVKIEAGSLGTFAGLDTNEYGQVKNSTGDIIEGLYAAGNDMSSIFDGHYPSGGITLGPAMTFGYLIANHLAEQKNAAPSAVTDTTEHSLKETEESTHAVL